MQERLTFLEILIQIFGAAFIWATGETGRVMLAGGAGGLVRWALDKKRTARNAVVQAVSGVLTAHYLWPLTLEIMTFPFPAVERTDQWTVAAGFASGLAGMSLAKIIMAAIDARMKGPKDEA